MAADDESDWGVALPFGSSRLASISAVPTPYREWCGRHGLSERTHDSLALWVASLQPLKLSRRQLVIAVDTAARPVFGDHTQVLLDALDALGMLGRATA